MKTKLSHSIMPTLATSLILLGALITIYLFLTSEGPANRNSFMMMVMFGFVPIASGIAFYVRYMRRKSFIKRMAQSAQKHKGVVTLNQLIDDTKILPVDIEHVLSVLLRNGKVKAIESDNDTVYDFNAFIRNAGIA